MKKRIALGLVLILAFSAVAETNYAFRTRMAELHPWRLAADAAPVEADEVLMVSGHWKVIVKGTDPDGVLNHGAVDLTDYLVKSMGVKPGEGSGFLTITIAVDPTLEKLQSKIVVDSSSIRITGVTPREAAQGCYRLEDLMTARGIPAVKVGSRTFTRMFSPRMTHSGWEIEKFPEVYMDQVAHAGMDAILVYIADPPDLTRNGRENIPALVKTAAKHGLDVYAYASFEAKAGAKHPLDEGAEGYYDSLYGSIVRNAPGLKGLICVGESVAFPSRDSHTSGFYWKKGEPGKERNGFWPSPDWKDWLELVTKVTRKYKPDFEIVFWTYNWFWAPEKDRLALLDSIQTNVTVHVTFEMGAPSIVKEGAIFHIEDYSITEPGPGTVFTSEAKLCKRRGIPLTAMANTGGRTWDFGGMPFEPVPYAWLGRFRNLCKAQADWGLLGLMDSHHYGYTPNFIAEIAKAAFTREFGDKEVEDTLRGIAVRDFGFANAEEVLAAWKDWSESFSWHSARDYDQSGPLRLGSSYPFTLPGVKFPPPPPPRKNWMYLRNSYMGAQDQLAPQIATDEKELALLRSGNARMERILSRVPDGKRKAAKRMLGLGKYMEATVRTLRNARKYRLEGLKGSSASKEALLAILDDEEKNVRGLIPWVENDSSLGFEPSMRYVTDPKMLQWKLKQLEDERAVLQNAGATFSARKRVRSNPRLRPSPSLASPISLPSLLQSNPHNIERKTKHG